MTKSQPDLKAPSQATYSAVMVNLPGALVEVPGGDKGQHGSPELPVPVAIMTVPQVEDVCDELEHAGQQLAGLAADLQRRAALLAEWEELLIKGRSGPNPKLEECETPSIQSKGPVFVRQLSKSLSHIKSKYLDSSPCPVLEEEDQGKTGSNIWSIMDLRRTASQSLDKDARNRSFSRRPSFCHLLDQPADSTSLFAATDTAAKSDPSPGAPAYMLAQHLTSGPSASALVRPRVSFKTWEAHSQDSPRSGSDVRMEPGRFPISGSASRGADLQPTATLWQQAERSWLARKDGCSPGSPEQVQQPNTSRSAATADRPSCTRKQSARRGCSLSQVGIEVPPTVLQFAKRSPGSERLSLASKLPTATTRRGSSSSQINITESRPTSAVWQLTEPSWSTIQDRLSGNTDVQRGRAVSSGPLNAGHATHTAAAAALGAAATAVAAVAAVGTAAAAAARQSMPNQQRPSTAFSHRHYIRAHPEISVGNVSVAKLQPLATLWPACSPCCPTMPLTQDVAGLHCASFTSAASDGLVQMQRSASPFTSATVDAPRCASFSSVAPTGPRPSYGQCRPTTPFAQDLVSPHCVSLTLAAPNGPFMSVASAGPLQRVAGGRSTSYWQLHIHVGEVTPIGALMSAHCSSDSALKEIPAFVEVSMGLLNPAVQRGAQEVGQREARGGPNPAVKDVNVQPDTSQQSHAPNLSLGAAVQTPTAPLVPTLRLSRISLVKRPSTAREDPREVNVVAPMLSCRSITRLVRPMQL